MRADQLPEESYLHNLGLTTQKQNAVNSLMRGISISDSEPIPDSALTLVQKVDLRQDNQEREPNLVRECIRSGCEILFSITLDRSILPETLHAKNILKADFEFLRLLSKRVQRAVP